MNASAPCKLVNPGLVPAPWDRAQIKRPTANVERSTLGAQPVVSGRLSAAGVRHRASGTAELVATSNSQRSADKKPPTTDDARLATDDRQPAIAYVSIHVAGYDPAHPLTIDPVLVCSVAGTSVFQPLDALKLGLVPLPELDTRVMRASDNSHPFSVRAKPRVAQKPSDEHRRFDVAHVKPPRHNPRGTGGR